MLSFIPGYENYPLTSLNPSIQSGNQADTKHTAATPASTPSTPTPASVHANITPMFTALTALALPPPHPIPALTIDTRVVGLSYLSLSTASINQKTGFASNPTLTHRSIFPLYTQNSQSKEREALTFHFKLVASVVHKIRQLCGEHIKFIYSQIPTSPISSVKMLNDIALEICSKALEEFTFLDADLIKREREAIHQRLAKLYSAEDTIATFHDKIQNFNLESYSIAALTFKAKPLGDFSLSLADCHAFSVNPEKWKRVSLCYTYVFYHLHIEQSIEFLFFNNKEEPKNVEASLKKWGFEQVSHPIPGDIALYQNDLSKGYIPIHYGIMKTKDIIVSKWGPGPVIEHGPFNCPEFYGSGIEFYRKTDRFKFVVDFRAALNTQFQLVKTTPRTWLVNYSKQLLKRCIELSKPKMFQDSLMGRSCAEKVYEKFVANLDAFIKANPEIQNDVLLGEILKIIDQSANEVPLDFSLLTPKPIASAN